MKSIRSDAAGLTRRFLANWTHFLAIHVAVSVLVFTLLTPTASLLLRLAVSLSGNAALSDQDILFFALSPIGFVSVLLLGSIFSIILFLGHAALLVVAESTHHGEAPSAKQVLAFLVGNADLNAYMIRNALVLMFVRRFDDHAATLQVTEQSIQFRGALADILFNCCRGFEIMKGNFERFLHDDPFRSFPLRPCHYCNEKMHDLIR